MSPPSMPSSGPSARLNSALVSQVVSQVLKDPAPGRGRPGRLEALARPLLAPAGTHRRPDQRAQHRARRLRSLRRRTLPGRARPQHRLPQQRAEPERRRQARSTSCRAIPRRRSAIAAVTAAARQIGAPGIGERDSRALALGDRRHRLWRRSARRRRPRPALSQQRAAHRLQRRRTVSAWKPRATW